MKSSIPFATMVAIATSLVAPISLANTLTLTHSPLSTNNQVVTTHTEGNAAQNIWNVITADISISPQDRNARVQHWVNYYTKNAGNRQYIETSLKRATPYIHYIYQQIKKRHMPARFTLLPIIESSYKATIVSNRGAAGLWQLMPGNLSSNKIHTTYWYNQHLNVIKSTKFALSYLSELHKEFGSWALAAAAYNDGEGHIRGAIHLNKRLHRPTDYWSLKLPKQTRDYVPKIMALAIIMKNPAKYHIKVPYVPNKQYFKAVKVNKSVTKSEIKKLADVSKKTLHKLNPNMLRTSSRPNHDFTVLLPTTKAVQFKQKFAQLGGHTATVVKT